MNQCCENPENRKTVEVRGDLTVTKCVVCECKHYELVVDPGLIGVKAAGP